MTKMTQCLLGRGLERQTAWIESRGAIINAKVELKTEHSEVWTVMATFDTISAEALAESQRAGRKHREATDI